MSAQQAPLPGPHQTRDLFGHAAAEARLVEAYRSGRQHHALIFAGPPGIGKATLAYRFAAFLLTHPDASGVPAGARLAIDPESRTARLVARLAHPDLIAVGPDMFAEENRSGEIKVDHVRFALARLYTTADAGGWRVCILDSADDLNRNAANALLKALEEPPPRTVFALVSHRPRRLAPTLRSRCVTIELRTPEPDDARRAILAARPDLAGAADLDEIIALGEGAPGMALRFAGHDGVQLNRRLGAIIAGLPRLDHAELHRLATDLANPRAEPRFVLFMDMLIAELARIAGRAARASRPGALEPWIELWDKVARAYDDAMALNLDRRQLILTACFGLEAAARRSAPR